MMAMGKGRHLAWATWVLCTGACGGSIVGGAVDMAGGGGQMGACAPGPAPQTAAEEVLDDYPDGQRCVKSACPELDPDQMGELGGINAIEPGTRQAEFMLGMFGKGCEWNKPDPPTCKVHAHGMHRGGNRRHNVCADVYGTYINDYYSLPPRGTVLLGDGSDAVVNSLCLDGIHIESDSSGTITLYVLWEMKTARYGYSSISGRPVCLYIKRKILANVFASILKEYPAVRLCGNMYRYQIVFADPDLYNAVSKLRELATELRDTKKDPATAAIHLMSWNRPVTVPDDIDAGRAVSIRSLLDNDLHVAKADLAEAEAIVVEYLTGPPPDTAMPFDHSRACDDWKLGDVW